MTVISRLRFLSACILICTLSTDAQWIQTNSGFTNTSTRALAVSGKSVFAGDLGGGVYRSSDNGSSWTQTNNGLSNAYVQALLASGTMLFAGTNGGGVFLSTDNGLTWTNTSLRDCNVLSLALFGTNIFAATAGNAYISTSNGTTWTAINSGLTNKYANIFAVLGTTIFLGTNNGIFRSTDNGQHWTEADAGLSGNALIVGALTTMGSVIIAGTPTEGAFRSVNGGETWVPAGTGMPKTGVISFATTGTTIFAGTTTAGVFCSTDAGMTWTPASTGLTKLQVFSFAISGSTIFAGTSGSLVWKRTLSEMTTGTDRTHTQPFEFRLGQNYPNPCNPSTTISFTLPTDSFAQLSVYDVMGRQVAMPLERRLVAGNHSLLWNAGDLPSGLYLYRLTSGRLIETRRMIVLK
jgi:photosystem II stability/assembly factor-like uncharacterized protein